MMPGANSEVNLEEIIGDRAICEWDADWVKVPGVVGSLNPALIQVQGLYRVTENNTITYIGAGVQKGGKGIKQRLRQILNSETTSNDDYGPTLIRMRKDHLSMEILNLGTWSVAEKFAVKLKNKLIEHHRYPWNIMTSAEYFAKIAGYD